MSQISREKEKETNCCSNKITTQFHLKTDTAKKYSLFRCTKKEIKFSIHLAT